MGAFASTPGYRLVHLESDEESNSSSSVRVNEESSGGVEPSSVESEAATKVQKVYRGYRTRRRLADSAVLAEELWWNVIDYARLNHSTISFFNFDKPETAASRWHRVLLNASKVGQGLSKDANAQKLAFQHWIEAIDPQHRYGHNLHVYYEKWCESDSGQPFFYWLDIGEGREVDLEDCPRSRLRKQCIKYLGPQEREQYEYILINGKIVHKNSRKLLDTNDGSHGAKWIFVVSTLHKLYVGEKKKGAFHHSSFLAGGATLAAGRLAVEHGIVKTISPHSGHYRPTNDSLESFLSFLKDNGVNVDEVRVIFFPCTAGKQVLIIKASEDSGMDRCSKSLLAEEAIKTITESQSLEIKLESEEEPKRPPEAKTETNEKTRQDLLWRPCNQQKIKPQLSRKWSILSGGVHSRRTEVPKDAILQRIDSKKATGSYQLGHQLSPKWSTGAGPRIGCINDYPSEVRHQALEMVSLSPWAQPSSPSAALSPTMELVLSI